jgi:hypothetical protein
MRRNLGLAAMALAVASARALRRAAMATAAGRPPRSSKEW